MKNLSIILLFLVTVCGLNLNAKDEYDSLEECYRTCTGSCVPDTSTVAGKKIIHCRIGSGIY